MECPVDVEIARDCGEKSGGCLVAASRGCLVAATPGCLASANQDAHHVEQGGLLQRERGFADGTMHTSLTYD